MSFQVVVHHVGWCFCQDFQCDIQTAAEIGNKDFDFGIWAGFADGFDAVGEVLGAAITQVVTVDGSNHDIAQVHGLDGFGQVFRLIRIQHIGAAMANIAERAAAGTNIAHDHECGRTLGKAFADIRTRCFFAYGMHFFVREEYFLISKNFLPGNLARIHSGFFNFCSNGTTLIGIRAVFVCAFSV